MLRAIIPAMNTITTAVKSLANLIYPLRCASCGKNLAVADEVGACGFCISQIRPNPKPYCRSCGRSLDDAHHLCPGCRKSPFHFSRAYSACLYEGALKDMIHAFKYKNNRTLSSLFTALITDFINDNREIIDTISVVTYVPLHTRRRQERGFNQSEALASGIARAFGIPMHSCLRKASHTKNQSELSRDERLVNVSGAFTAGGPGAHAVKGRYVLLVDDVMTTGATLNECSRALIEAGAVEVRCLTLARGL